MLKSFSETFHLSANLLSEVGCKAEEAEKTALVETLWWGEDTEGSCLGRLWCLCQWRLSWTGFSKICCKQCQHNSPLVTKVDCFLRFLFPFPWFCWWWCGTKCCARFLWQIPQGKVGKGLIIVLLFLQHTGRSLGSAQEEFSWWSRGSSQIFF